jgi:tetratricopeptide (TPR) repeat protein
MFGIVRHVAGESLIFEYFVNSSGWAWRVQSQSPVPCFLKPVTARTHASFSQPTKSLAEECNKAIELDASNPGARWFLALALERRNRIPEAIEQLKRAVEDSHRGAVFVSALVHALWSGGAARQRPC